MSQPQAPAVLSYASPTLPDVFPARARAKWIVILAAAQVVLAASEIFVYSLQHALLERAANGVRPSPAEASMNDLRVAVAAGFSSLVAVALMVLLLCWIYRVYRNKEGMRMSPQFSAGWAVGYWFIPILNLFRSYQESREILQLNGQRDGETGALGTWWWASWFFGSLVPVIYTVARMERDEIRGLVVQTDAQIIGAVFSVLSAILLIAFVRRAQQYQANEILHRAGTQLSATAQSAELLSATPPPPAMSR